MIAKTYSIIPDGFNGSTIEIEGDRRHGLPGLNIVGMANKTVSEARERVKSAICSSGFIFPDDRVTINLAPAELEKNGTHLDLAIALNILILSNQLQQKDLADSIFVGELSLDGSIRPVSGIINVVESAKKAGFERVFVPDKNFAQASLIKNIELVRVTDLSTLFLYLKGQLNLPLNPTVVKNTRTPVEPLLSLDQIQGQTLAKRALEIAVAGHHNILLYGPPGTGKTMLAKSALSLLPPLNSEEIISVTKIHALTGSTSIVNQRPFCTPHHTSTLPSIIGGGPRALPGEISLAHLGILFLDELPEYPRQIIEALRQPLEDRQISIMRAKKRVVYPADFMLIATMNPCPCGYLGDEHKPCMCTSSQIQNYQKKLSGPFLDRIDLFTNVNRIKTSELFQSKPQTSKSTSPIESVVKNNITGAIKLQHYRYQNSTLYNASLSTSQIQKHISLDYSVKSFLDHAASSLDLSARSYFKILKVARTIADLEQSQSITRSHIAEALSFRQFSFQPSHF